MVKRLNQSDMKQIITFISFASLQRSIWHEMNIAEHQNGTTYHQ
jgi:hypothetical protein